MTNGDTSPSEPNEHAGAASGQKSSSAQTQVPATQRAERTGNILFMASLVGLVAASLFAGAALWPMIQRARAERATPTEGQIALTLEHAAVDVRLGHGAHLAPILSRMAGKVHDPVVKQRVLGLWAAAALQAGRLSDAATAEREREALLKDPRARNAVRLQRIGLLGALGRKAEAAALAKPLIQGTDQQLADAARLRLVAATMNENELKKWVAAAKPGDPETARRAGLAALRLLGDAKTAQRLLSGLVTQGHKDVGIETALLDADTELKRPADAARVPGDQARASIRLVEARALADSGDVDGGLKVIDDLLASERVYSVRRAARRTRFDLLEHAGRLKDEVAKLEKNGDWATRAFVALEVQHNYALALKLYQRLAEANPDSRDFAEAEAEAAQKADLADRRSLYEKVLTKDPNDGATREKLLGVLVALGDAGAAQRLIGEMLKGKESSPDALLKASVALERAGLGQQAAGLLQKAYAAESDTAKKQQIAMALGELYATGKEQDSARRVFAELAQTGVSSQIRSQAVARLAALLP